jgi:molybdate transport system permease protein
MTATASGEAGAVHPKGSGRPRGRGRRVGGERLPWPILILALIGLAFFALPFFGLLWKAPWGNIWSILTSESSLDALRLSIYCSLWASGLSVLFGVPLAWLLARIEFPGRGAARALCTLSMVLPPVVAGVALFYALGRRGLVGQYLDRWFGITLPFTTTGVIVAQTFVAMPFLVITVRPHPRGVALVCVPPGHPPRNPARPRRRCRTRLGSGVGRVRCHDHLRR